MVVPAPIACAAQNGNVTAVEAWLNEGGDVNDCDELNDNLLILCASTPHTRTASHTDLVRLLIERGADVNSLALASQDGTGGGLSPLHYACDRIADVSADMVSLLVNANANVHCRARDALPGEDGIPEVTPLGMTLWGFPRLNPNEGSLADSGRIPRTITMLLRAGASLDAVSDDKTAEEALRAAAEAEPDLRDNDIFVQTKALIDDVRAAGSWKLYCRQDHKKILRLRSLVARGRATPKKWSPRGHDRRAIEFLVKIGDNGIAWKILSFWKET